MPTKNEINNLINFYQSGDFLKAEKLAFFLTNKYSKFQLGWKILGILFLKKGIKNKAIFYNQKAIDLSPKDEQSYFNLACCLQTFKNLKEAETNYKKAIQIKPDYAEAYNNLGITLKDLNRIEESEASYRQAIKFNPTYFEAFYNLANLFRETQRFEEAETNYKKAIQIKPDYAEAYNNLGITLKDLNRIEESEASYRQAIKFNPTYFEAISNWCYLIKGMKFIDYSPEVEKIISYLLDENTLVRARSLSIPAISIIKTDPFMSSILKNNLSKNIPIQDLLESLSNVNVLNKFISISPLPDLELENFLMGIRKKILLNISNISLNQSVLNFLSSLSLHCFINEYLYDVSLEECQILKILEKEILEKIDRKEELNLITILSLTTYKPLNNFSWHTSISSYNELKKIYLKQVIEPECENEIRNKIPLLKKINDQISINVKDQYEKNPYPRWVNLSIPLKQKNIEETIKDLNLKTYSDAYKQISSPKILIAGCGTGQNSIETASRYKDSSVLSIDLSLSSIGYAKRNTDKLNIKNIKYMQGDIIDINNLNEQFDIIESIGVLHHMSDPLLGLSNLISCLRPGGFIKLGLYSEIARSHIITIRDEIKKLNLETNLKDMKLLRKKIINSKQNHHLKLLSVNDFYNLSEFRDLLFNVEEHCFKLSDIKDFIFKLNIEFCGFENNKIIKSFNDSNSINEDIYNLDNWDVFEKNRPDTFIEMYQFWCQKKII